MRGGERALIDSLVERNRSTSTATSLFFREVADLELASEPSENVECVEKTLGKSALVQEDWRQHRCGDEDRVYI